MSDSYPHPVSVLEILARWGVERDWVGPDPYEGLNTPLGRATGTRRARQAVTQLYKRFPVTPPWPLRVRWEPNAKAFALVLSGYATQFGQALPGADEYLQRLPRRLAQLNLRRAGAAWGYPFDVQTRSIHYTRETPNAIVTCFVVDALLDAYQATGEGAHADLAIAARPFLLSLRKHSPHGPFFAYVERGSELVHNASMLVCGALARLHRLQPDPAAAAAVREVVETTISLQRPDGLWDYGEADGLRWADNFHTAYTIEGLVRTAATFDRGADTLRRALPAWREAFFEPDGAARYLPWRRFPLEPHSYASAIDLLCTIASSQRGEGQHDLIEFGRRIAASAIRELWLPDAHRFAYARTRLRLNRRPFVRWTNAPMFRALARLASGEK